jgi:hypothetical protein
MHTPDPEFVPPEPIDPLDRAWQPPPEPNPGPSWWLFGPGEDAPSYVVTFCARCDGMGTVDGFEPCPLCGGSGDRPDWWL